MTEYMQVVIIVVVVVIVIVNDTSYGYIIKDTEGDRGASRKQIPLLWHLSGSVPSRKTFIGLWVTEWGLYDFTL